MLLTRILRRDRSDLLYVKDLRNDAIHKPYIKFNRVEIEEMLRVIKAVRRW